MKLAQKELGLKGVRYHGIFDDDNGPVVTTNASLGNSPLSPRNCSYSYSYSPDGKFAYNWTNVLDSWDYQVAELGQYFSPIHFFLCNSSTIMGDSTLYSRVGSRLVVLLWNVC